MEKNLKFLRWYLFYSAMWPMSSVIILYFQGITGSYASAMFVYSLSSLTQTLMELPSGIISDKFQRKHVLILTSLCLFSSFLFWALAGATSSIICLVIGSLLAGLNQALTSGTIEAFIFETVQSLPKEQQNFAKAYSKINTFSQVGLGLGSLFAALFLWHFSMRALAWFCAIPAALAFIHALCFTEPQRLYTRKSLSSFSSLLIALRRFKRNKNLSFFAFIRILESSVEVTIHRFEAAYFKSLISESLIALIRVFKQIFGAFGFYLFSFISKHNPLKTYKLSLLLNTFFRTLAVLLNNTLTPFFMAFINLFYGPTTTTSTAILQQNFSAQQRATLHSLLSLASGFMVVLMMWVLGFIADMFSPQTAILSAVIFKILMVLCPLLFKGKKHAEK